MTIPKEILKEKFKNIYFINGLAYAGKSTMVHLLAEKHGGIECGENYHDALLDGLDKEEFPGLCYTRDLQDWRHFIRRSPEEYFNWTKTTSKECEKLELEILAGLADSGKKIFVDTNIYPETLHEIAQPDHVLIMLADKDISVNRFFERPDREKQFLYQLLMTEPEPEKAMANFRRGLELINSQEKYDYFLNCGFNVLKRDENRTVEETLAIVEKFFGLDK